ncbi:MAG: ribonuclease R [Pseudodesulfovibrio sp.]|uniref:Ribonuclease R n=3 Tax=Pseudodesulfovibrio aespoeensis TaxID=182210 RepID=E6VWW0_PSEA9|nr:MULTISPECIES: ribonuclease R [Pseudodesulfovibrio]MBU4191188.1 ribonuclease R [Pseudomonadota bacterium]ADU63722.1 ribonuclease R [Pseudodesulfovibrio aespoeensis Aspo-2]MBU4243513.1 ribonuclease R [Pseudomonadota bacterium]MBU4377586.1 ribonuclease R [Pseudomonadota bacterium]MBU4515464.1 ribonuclease R [Pseudomonadota bacterium]
MAKNRRKQSGPGPATPPLSPATVLRVFKEVRRPMSGAEVIRQLKLKKKEKSAVKEMLHELVEQGKLIRIRRGYGLAEAMHCITGRLEIQRGGFGFVVPEDSRRRDVFINQRDIGDAWHGDKVVAAIVRENKGDRNNEGRVVRVLERGRKVLPVKIHKRMRGGEWLCRPTDPRLGFGIIAGLADETIEVRPGDIALCAPGERIDPTMWEGQITAYLGPETDISVQEALVKSNHNIRLRFPSGALSQAEGMPQEPSGKDLAGRRDLTRRQFVTIDGATARDFDDAILVERAGNGYVLWVAIADVAHYVHEGTPLDREALERGNSYYFPQSVEPMFPERLSNGLCSLNPDVNRLVMVARMEADPQGVTRRTEVFPAVIRSQARLTYGQIKRGVLDGEAEERAALAPVLSMLELAVELARKINGLRTRRGSLDFDLPEPEILFDVHGDTKDIRPRIRHFGHQLIEEFMIAANEAVARFLTERELPCLFRIHPPADEERLKNLFRLLGQTDPSVVMPKEITPRALQLLIASQKGTDKEYVVNRMLLRSMKQAKYSPDNEGHFGLASDEYCHFTSPIRRYADLVVHRLVKGALAAKDESQPSMAIPGRKKLFNVAGHLSGRERAAMDAEREIHKRVMVLFMRDKVGGTYGGVISHITDYGFYVELREVMAEGMVRLSSMDDDYYTYWPQREMLVGERTGQAFKLGQSVEVVLEEASLERLELSFTLKSIADSAKDYKDLI